ncbi:MAG: ATP-grasp domain-containing protein [Ignavibacteria bacterium]|nr:ATP-grasp domain-containing protein [Ignavibacteria bacterium]
MKKTDITIAVTGLNAIDSPGPGISVIRALRKSNYYNPRIIGLSYDTMEPGIYMHDLVDKSFQIPFPSVGIDNLLYRLKEINDKEKIDVIIPNFDAELFNFIKLEKRLLEECNIKMFLPSMKQFEERQKANLYEFGKKYNLKVPKNKTIYSLKDINDIEFEFSFPVVVKGKYYDARVAYNKDQIAEHFNRISIKWGLPIIIQEYVFGSEVNVTAIGDGTGKTIGAVPMRKQYITDKGKAWSGISLDDDKLLKITTDLIKSTKWKGSMELEFIKTSNDEYFLLEINPRFPAWVYLAVGCGQNHPDALLKMALGKKVNAFPKHETGKMFIRYSYDMIINLKEFEKISTSGEL